MLRYTKNRACPVTGGLLLVSIGWADTADDTAILERLQRLEENQSRLEAQVREKDARIRELESTLGIDTPAVDPAAETAVFPVEGVAEGEPVGVVSAAQQETENYFSVFQEGGRGFKLANTPRGDLNFSAWAYVRYLNQQGLDDTYTDSFGRTRELDLRNDIQLNKVNLYFKGWIYDPDFRYLLYIWTANTSQGEAAQVVVAGSLNYTFNEHATLGAGIGALPGTRSLRGNFPYWNKVDTRPMADEFFPPQLHHRGLVGG